MRESGSQAAGRQGGRGSPSFRTPLSLTPFLTNERGGLSGQSTGSLVGIVVGAVVGLILAIPTGGLSIPAGLSLGASIGGTVGGLAGALYDTQTASDNVFQQDQLSRIFIQDSGYAGAIPQIFQRYRLAGNVVWLGPKLRHEHRETESAGGKGGGPQNITITYTYTVSLAVLLCDTRLSGPMAGISRIWSDGTVIYNRDTHHAFPDEWTFYSGSADQGQDPTIEAQEGAARTPAYRYRCYIVGTDVPLGATGRVPNYTFEVYQVEEAASAKLNVAVAPSDGHVWTIDPAGELLELDPDTQETAGPTTHLAFARPIPAGSATMLDVAPDGTAWLGVQALYRVWRVSGTSVTGHDVETSLASSWAFLGSTAYLSAFNYQAQTGHLYTFSGASAPTETGHAYGTWYRLASTGSAVWCVARESRTLERFTSGGALAQTVSVPGHPYDLAIDGSGQIWVSNNEDSQLHRYSAAGALQLSVAAALGAVDVAIADDGFVWVCGSSQLTRHDPTTGAITLTEPVTVSNTGNPGYRHLAPSDAGAVWVMDYPTARLWRVQPSGASQVVRLPLYPQTLAAGAAGSVWFCSDQARLVGRVTSDMRIHLEQFPSQLPALLTTLATAAGIPGDAVDVSLVPQTPILLGILNIEAARVPIEMLCRAYQLLPVESNGVLKFLPRPQATLAASIPQEALLATEDTGSDGTLVVRTPEALMPTAVQVLYIDPQQSYQQNTQRATVVPARQGVEFANERTIQALIGLTPQQAKRLAQEALDRLWIERTQVSFATTRRYAALEPGDVVEVTVRGLTYPVLLTEVAYGRPGLVRCKGQLNSVSVLDQWVELPGEGPDQTQPPVYIVPTTAVFLHLPALGPQDVASRYHVVYEATASGWYGVQLWKAQDTVDYQRLDTSTLRGITGTATLLPAASPHLLDDVSTVDVTLTHGSLLSVTDSQLLNGANLCVIGEELLHFGHAELVSTATYRLSRLLRGRRGTEHTVGTHTAGERFVLLDTGVHLLPLPLAERNVPQQYKPVSTGQTLADVDAVTHSPDAKNLLPWSPSYPTAVRVADDWQLSWFMRCRFNSLWTSENEEVVADPDIVSYQVRLWDGSTVVRTQTVALAAAVRDQVLWVYSASLQVQDFGSVQTTITWSVRQRGNYGWGDEWRETVSG